MLSGVFEELIQTKAPSFHMVSMFGQQKYFVWERLR